MDWITETKLLDISGCMFSNIQRERRLTEQEILFKM